MDSVGVSLAWPGLTVKQKKKLCGSWYKLYLNHTVKFLK